VQRDAGAGCLINNMLGEWGAASVPISRSDAAATSAFDEQFARTQPRLHRICQNLAGPDAAEDIVQDVYLLARERFGQLRNPLAFDTWITRIAVRQCYNASRRRRRLLERLPLIGSLRAAPEPSDLGLRELVERLPPRERSLVVLHYGYGYRIDEIAALLEISATNARTILFRARAKLGAQLTEPMR
jgi:RNA polymerase sigma-70 factor (ECF subfamily)